MIKKSTWQLHLLELKLKSEQMKNYTFSNFKYAYHPKIHFQQFLQNYFNQITAGFWLEKTFEAFDFLIEWVHESVPHNYQVLKGVQSRWYHKATEILNIIKG